MFWDQRRHIESMADDQTKLAALDHLELLAAEHVGDLPPTSALYEIRELRCEILFSQYLEQRGLLRAPQKKRSGKKPVVEL